VPNISQTIRQAGCGVSAAAAVTALCFPLHVEFPVVGCLFLLIVVLQSAFSTFAASAIVSVVTIACLDYFFVPPVFTLQISRPLDGVALLTFLVTGLVITRLASRAREEARNAEARRSDLARLYDLASQLVSVGPDVAVKREYLWIFQDVFHLRAVSLFDGAAAASKCHGESQHNLRELTRQAYLADRDYDRDDARIAVRCFRAGGKAIGAVGFEGLEEASSMAGPLSMLTAAMVQRAHSFEHASEAAAATQVEVLRTAILDAFAHQFKTPLAAILAAAGGLREAGLLAAHQEEMVETIETQSAGLGHLTTRLLRMARLDRDEIKPRLQPTDLAAVIRRIANQYRDPANGHELILKLGDGPVEVMSDPDLLGLAIVQLLDNAFRYSPPGTTITALAALEDGDATVLVTNQGPPILPEEQSRIFDRFYRGAAGHQVSGTGLGLYVARKIVVAHGGSLELDTRHRNGQYTTFCLRLPMVRDEARQHELKAS